MKFPHIIGADLSKKTLDFASHQLKKHLKVENNSSGFRDLVRWLKGLQINCCEVMIVMEHTGLYSYQLELFLHKNNIAFTKVSALAIKLSLGIVRGKSDKQDAKRIARYGFEKAGQLSAVAQQHPALQRLQILHSTRERLVKHRAALITAVKEYRDNCGLAMQDMIIKSQMQLVRDFDRQIQKLELEMKTIVEDQASIKQNYCLLQSIKGVGKVLALAAIIKTGNFSRFNNARKFACFCGTAPFEKTSGSSIRGKTGVSHLADKRMKTLLDLAAKSAIQYDKELKEYYLKRTTNGKSKMSTINVVRNKLLFRMFAVIKRQTPFTENYLQVA